MTEHELFKEAVMQYMVDDTRARHIAAKRKKNHIARRVLTTAACIVAALAITVMAIPSARAAVEEWLDEWFDAREYFQKEREEREEEPSIEAIITSAGENDVVVTEVGDGFEEYAAEFGMTLDEIAYDGSSVFVTGTMPGATARPFAEAWTGGDTFRIAENDGSLGGDSDWDYYYFACENVVTLKTADGGVFYGELCLSFTDEMNEIVRSLVDVGPENVFENGELVTTNARADELWDEYLFDHDVRFSIELEPAYTDMQPLSGTVEGELTLRMFYDNIVEEAPVSLLDADLGTITIDAEAYQTQTTQAMVGTSVQLGGVHPVTMMEWQATAERTSNDCETYYYTHELDFTGASVTVKEITFTPTDTKLMLHVVLPETWTGAERAYGNLAFRFLLDGETAGEGVDNLFSVCGPRGTNDETGEELEYDCGFWESTISPSQWAEAKTLTIIPTTVYWWEMYVQYDDGPEELVSLRDGAVYTGVANHTGWRTDEQYDEMTQYAITINLDDYR